MIPQFFATFASFCRNCQSFGTLDVTAEPWRKRICEQKQAKVAKWETTFCSSSRPLRPSVDCPVIRQRVTVSSPESTGSLAATPSPRPTATTGSRSGEGRREGAAASGQR